MARSNSTIKPGSLMVALIVLIALALLTKVGVVIAVDGDLDPTFGTPDPSIPAGVTRTFFGSSSTDAHDFVKGLGLQSTGKIIAVGNTDLGGGSQGHFALVRYNTNGTLDTTFGSSGKVTTDFNTNTNNQPTGVAIDPGTDKIVVVGQAGSASSGLDWAIARYNADGSLDTGACPESFAPSLGNEPRAFVTLRSDMFSDSIALVV